MIRKAPYDTEFIVKQIKSLQHKREHEHTLKSSHLSAERIRLAKVLIERLEDIEKKSGLFLIKPIATTLPQQK